MTSKAFSKIKDAIENEYPEGWYVEELAIVEKDLEVLEMLEENKDILTDLINYEIARLKMAMFMCDNGKIHIIRLSKLEKIKELLNEK